MNRLITSTAIPARAAKIEALANMTASFESFCLASEIVALVFISEQPTAPLDPSPPQFIQAPVASSSSLLLFTARGDAHLTSLRAKKLHQSDSSAPPPAQRTCANADPDHRPSTPVAIRPRSQTTVSKGACASIRSE